MKRRGIIAVLLTVIVMGLVGCKPEETHLNVSPSQLYGRWQRTSTQEYWRYYDDGTGVTWDEADDITEQESNLVFTWTLQQDRLTHVFTGAQGNQAVPKVYTVTAINSASMEWEDDYKMQYSFIKVE